MPQNLVLCSLTLKLCHVIGAWCAVHLYWFVHCAEQRSGSLCAASTDATFPIFVSSEPGLYAAKPLKPDTLVDRTVAECNKVMETLADEAAVACNGTAQLWNAASQTIKNGKIKHLSTELHAVRQLQVGELDSYAQAD